MRFILIFILVFLVQLYSDNTQVKSDAKQMGKEYSNYYENNLDRQIFTPMTNENSKLSTKDGSQSGSAYITCGDSKPFAKISYIGLNDITISVQLNVDNNDDNGYETIQSFSGVSGLTATGIIKCTAGTFSNCKYYDWNYNNSDLIYLTQTNRANSADAYCINSSCGSLASTQKSKILGDIAGALSSAFSGYSSYTVTKTNVTSNYIELYGQNYENCSDSDTQFDSNITEIPDSLDGESQMNDSNESYTTITSIVENENKNPTTTSDYSDMQSVVSTSVLSADTSDEDQRVITYKYKSKNDDGNTTIQNLSSTMDVDLDNDTEYCMVAWESKYTGVATDDSVRGSSSNNGLTTTIEEEFRECVDGVCPYTAPEYIKYDCGNTDDSLYEAVSVLSAIKELEDDISCSTK